MINTGQQAKQATAFAPLKKVKLPFQPSILFYLILMNLILLCLLFPAISFVFLQEDTKFRDAQLDRTIMQMRQNLENRSASLARNMSLSASQAIAGYDFTFLNIMVRQVVFNDPEIIYAIIMDTNQLAMAHSNPDKTGSLLDNSIDQRAAEIIKNDFPKTKRPDQKEVSIRFIDFGNDSDLANKPVMEVLAPVYNGSQLSGVLRFGYSLQGLHDEIQVTARNWTAKLKQFKRYFLSLTTIFFTIGLLVAGLFTRFFVKATRILDDGVNRVSEGDLDHVIENKNLTCAEFSRLANSFNDMTLKLRKSYQKLDEYNKSLEQKVEERTRELKEAQATLLQQAHESGMAEMAVGILHNIGNAITPAKVGATLLAKKLRNSPLRNHLHEAMTQIHEVVEKSTVPSDDEKKRLLGIIKLLPENIQEEYDHAITNIQEIENKHHHIESIIGLQMRYAKVFDDGNTVNINYIVDDALKMLDDTLAKQSVEIVKNFSEVPEVKIEQTKLMQVVINLIKNGYEAMVDLEPGKKRLMISTYLEDKHPPYVVLSIKDEGVGFTPKEKEKLFHFGFSNKGGGSGFGLHSCANYLIANNGSITAHSEGKDKGAEFTVRLAPTGNDQRG